MVAVVIPRQPMVSQGLWVDFECSRSARFKVTMEEEEFAQNAPWLPLRIGKRSEVSTSHSHFGIILLAHRSSSPEKVGQEKMGDKRMDFALYFYN